MPLIYHDYYNVIIMINILYFIFYTLYFILYTLYILYLKYSAVTIKNIHKFNPTRILLFK